MFSSWIRLDDFFQVKTNSSSSSSSFRASDPKSTLKVPRTVLVFPVPGGPWISVIPYCFKLSCIALYWELLNVFFNCLSNRSGIANFFSIYLLCKSGLSKSSFNWGLIFPNPLRALKILYKVVMVVMDWINHFLLELTISKFYLEKQCSSKNTLTWTFGSEELYVIPIRWGWYWINPFND